MSCSEKHTCTVCCTPAGFNSRPVINSEKRLSPKHKYWHIFGPLLSNPAYCWQKPTQHRWPADSCSVHSVHSPSQIPCVPPPGPLLILNTLYTHIQRRTLLPSYPCMTSWDGVSFWYLSETFPSPEEPESRTEICYHIADTARDCSTFTLRAIDIGRYFFFSHSLIIWRFNTAERGNQDRILYE